MSIISLKEIERLKIYDEIERRYRCASRDIRHDVLTRMEDAFIYGIFDDIERVGYIDDPYVESSFDLGKKYYDKNDFIKDHGDIYELFMNAEYEDGAVNPFLLDRDLIGISVKIKLYFYSTIPGPQVHVYLGFDNVGEIVLKFTIDEDGQNKSETGTSDTSYTCSEEHVKEFLKWLHEHDVS